MVRVKKFSFKLSDFAEGDSASGATTTLGIPDEETGEGLLRRWKPFHVDASPEFDSVWVWAYIID